MKKPALRFKGFDGEWEKKTLADLARVYDGVHQTPDYKATGVMFLSVEDIDTLKSNKYISEDDFERDYKVYPEIGDVLMTRIGVIGATNVVRTTEKIAYYVSLALLKPNNINSDFLSNLIRSPAFQKGLMNRSLLTAVPQKINKNEIGKVETVCASDRAEQITIGSFFTELDSLIEGKRVKLDKLKKLKLAYLGKMFPKKGSRVPEVRFKGFSGDWDAVPFDKVMTFLSNNTLSRADLNNVDGDVQNVHYGDVLIKLGEVLDLTKEKLPFINAEHDFSKLSSSMLKDGDIVIADTAEDETAGKCTEIRNIENKKVVAGLHTMPCRPNMNFALGYLGYYMNSPSYHSQLLKYMQGTKVVSISKHALANTVLSCPKDKVEQQKIGAFFQNLDNLINLQQQELDKLANIKSACLSKMFA